MNHKLFAFLLLFAVAGGIAQELTWSTYFGGQYDDRIFDIESDHEGNIYVVGRFEKEQQEVSEFEFYDPNCNAHFDTSFPFGFGGPENGGGTGLFISKFTNDGVLLWSTMLGSGISVNGIQLKNLEVDSAGNVFATGWAARHADIGPFGPLGSFQKVGNSAQSGFILKITACGELIWSTAWDNTQAIPGYITPIKDHTIDPFGNLYCTGWSDDNNTGRLPWLNPGGGAHFKGAQQGTSTSCPLLAKYDNDGQLLWMTFTGDDRNFSKRGLSFQGIMYEADLAIASDSKGNIFTAGTFGNDSFSVTQSKTYNDTNHIPLRKPGPNAFYQDSLAVQTQWTDYDVMLKKFDVNGKLVWGTFFGGVDWESVFDIGIDSRDNLYVVGWTFGGYSYWGWKDIPFVDPGGGAFFLDEIPLGPSFVDLYGTNAAVEDSILPMVFIAKFDKDLQLVWSTYFTALFGEMPFLRQESWHVDFDGADNLYITGRSGKFLPTQDAGGTSFFQPSITDTTGAFIAKFDSGGALKWSTYFGDGGLLSNAEMTGRGIDVDNNGNIFVAGSNRNFHDFGNTASNTIIPIVDPGDNAYIKTSHDQEEGWIAKFTQNPSNFKYANIAGSTVVKFFDKTINNPTAWSWNFGDPASGAANTSGSQHPTHIFTSNGNFKVTLSATVGGLPYVASKNIIVDSTSTIVVLGDDTICFGDAVQLSASAAYTQQFGCVDTSNKPKYCWWPSFGLNDPTSQNPIATPLITTTYYAIATSYGICGQYTRTVADSITIIVDGDIQVSLNVSDTIVCQGDSIILVATSDSSNVNYTWNTSDTGSTITVTTSGLFIVNGVKGADSCGGVAFVNVTFLPPSANLPNDTAICDGGSLTLFAGPAGPSYIWSNGASTNSINVDSSGLYTVIVGQGGCTDSLGVNVDIGVPIIVSLGTDTTLCDGDSISLDAGILDLNYLWSTNETTQAISVANSNTYWVIATDTNGCIGSDSVFVFQFISNGFDLGVDTLICIGNSLNLSANIPGASYLWNTADTLNNIDVNQSGIYTLTVTHVCGSIMDSIGLGFSTPSLSLNDELMCIGDSLVIDAGLWDSYLWSTSEQTRSIVATQLKDYWVEVEDQFSCKTTDTTSIDEDIDCELPMTYFIPNAFSPGKDDINVVFNLTKQGVNWYELSVFDRWGKLVFKTTSPDHSWNGLYAGKDVNTRVYQYYLRGEYIDGSEFSQSSNVIVIR